MRTLLPVLLLIGCAAKAPRMPGPLGSMGKDRAVAMIRVDEPAARPVRKNQRRNAGGTHEELAEAARHYLEVAPRGFRDDCSGYVEAVFARVGLALEGSTAAFYERAKALGALHHDKVPSPGDLAFFDDTYDRNRNGELDDPLSHVAVVLEVRPNGTILLGHGGTSRGRTTLTMNLARPDAREDGEDILNDWLRVRRDSDPGGTKYLAGELWRAFADFSDADALASQ